MAGNPTPNLRRPWGEFPVVIFGMLLLLPAAARAQPVPPVRVIAEWEPALGTLISWPLGIPQSLVVELARDDLLFVLVNGPTAENQARATLSSWGVDPARVSYIQSTVQTHWPRDWGPHQIFDGQGRWGIIDPIFQGYPWVGPACAPITSPGGYAGDDAVNIAVAAHFAAPLHSFPGYLVGGNFLVDGHAAAFSTCMMIGENNQLWTEAEFLDLAQQYLGVTDYHIVNNTENNGIQHIDCWFKVLDSETLLVKRVPAWHEEYLRIEGNLTLLEQAVNQHGRPYRIIRIDCPPYSGNRVAAYTNALILNRKVLVPLFNIPGDAAALQTYRAAMPGYQVIGFPWGSWYYYDALHCRTRAIFDRHMLRIVHRRIDATMPAGVPIRFTALVDDRSETGLLPGSPRVVWRRTGGAWQEVPMTATGDEDTYEAFLPGLAAGPAVEYYIAAQDHSGRSETMPRTAPDGFYSFAIIDTGLSVRLIQPPDRIAPWTPTVLHAEVLEGHETLMPGSVTLHYRLHGGDYLAMPMNPTGPLAFEAVLPRVLCDDSPAFYVSAVGSSTGLKTDPPNGPEQPYEPGVGEWINTPLLAEDFAGGLPTGWAAGGLWHATSVCPVVPLCESGPWVYYGRDAACNYATGGRTSGTLTSPAINLPAQSPQGNITLSYCSTLVTENQPGYDVAGLYVGDTLVDTPAESSAWEQRTIDLTAYAGQTVTLSWVFDSIDGYYNGYRGWQVDRIRVTVDQLGCQFLPPFVAGDANCDGGIDLLDIASFVLLLTDEAAYHAAQPQCHWSAADCNGDGLVDGADIDGFVRRLLNG